MAVSRARRALIVLGHPLIRELGSPTLASLRAYLRDEVTRNDGAGTPVAEFRTDSTSERFLLDAMQLGDLLPYAKLDVEGYELDFALLEEGIKLNVEVDGDPALGRPRATTTARTLHETASWPNSVGLSYGYRRGDAMRKSTL